MYNQQERWTPTIKMPKKKKNSRLIKKTTWTPLRGRQTHLGHACITVTTQTPLSQEEKLTFYEMDSGVESGLRELTLSYRSAGMEDQCAEKRMQAAVEEFKKMGVVNEIWKGS